MKKLLTILLSLILLLPACSPAATLTAVDPIQTQKTEATSTPALFQIIRPDGTTFGVTLEALKALPLATVTAEGKVEEGPFLSDVLSLAGITRFTEVSLTGSSNPATLTFEQVNENTILDFNNHGTLKLSTLYIPKANWTKDVAKIVVK
jgi:hypothetical protein